MSKNNTIRKSLTKNVVDVAQALISVKHPGEVISEDMTSWVKVGEGNLLRVIVTAATYVIFDDDGQNSTTADAAASPGLYLAVGEHYIVCQSEYVKMSANPTRKELLRL
jgi:hypothetical protein